MRQMNLFALVFAFLILLIVPLFINHDVEEPHKHITVRYAYADGVRHTKVTYCLTDSLQVNFEGEHFQSELSEAYFGLHQRSQGN